MLHADVALGDKVVDLLVHGAQATLQRLSLIVVLRLKSLDLLSHEVLEALQFIPLNRFLLAQLAQLIQLLVQRGNVSLLSDDGTFQVLHRLIVQFQRVVGREQLIIGFVGLEAGSHLLIFELLHVLGHLSD